MTGRFSKKKIKEDLMNKIEALEKRFNFQRHVGWVQVERKGEEINRFFGEYSLCLLMLDWWRL